MRVAYERGLNLDGAVGGYLFAAKNAKDAKNQQVLRFSMVDFRQLAFISEVKSLPTQ